VKVGLGILRFCLGGCVGRRVGGREEGAVVWVFFKKKKIVGGFWFVGGASVECCDKVVSVVSERGMVERGWVVVGWRGSFGLLVFGGEVECVLR